MKDKMIVASLLLTLCLSGYLFFKYVNIERQLEQLKLVSESTSGNIELETKDEFELAPVMGRLQVYANKLWFAGNAANWELAGFYVHEIEEAFEQIEEHDIIENGVEISDAIKEWGLTPLERMEAVIKSSDKNGFSAEYDVMISNCNGCHVVTRHNFIKITRPQIPAFSNQAF